MGQVFIIVDDVCQDGVGEELCTEGGPVEESADDKVGEACGVVLADCAEEER